MKTKTIFTDNLEKTIIEYAGEAPPKGFKPPGQTTRFGRDSEGKNNNKFSALIFADGKGAYLTDHTGKKPKQHFCLKNHTFKEKKKSASPPPPTPEDLESQFYKYPEVTKHPYLKAKRVSGKGVGLRQDERGNLLVPMCSLKTLTISNYQKISNKKENGKWFKCGVKGASNKDVFFTIGDPDSKKYIYIAEGLSTALTVNGITKCLTYLCFGKNNLDSVIDFCLKEYPLKFIVCCLDHDKEDPKVKISDSRVVFLRPEERGDFNDFQSSDAEISKLLNLKPAYDIPKPKEPVSFTPDPDNPVADLKARLSSLGYELRLNTRKDRIEINKGKGWGEVTKEGMSALFFEVQTQVLTPARKVVKILRKIFNDSIEAVVFDNQCDPFQEYLKSLEWDGKKRLDNFLLKVFNVKNRDHKKFAKWALKSIMLATVWRTFVPGHKHDEMIIFQGKQGIGKSSFLFHLFEDKSFFSNTLYFSDRHERIVEGMLGKCIIELPELCGFKKTDVEKMKNLISTQQDTVRLSYRKDARDYLRRCIFVGTTNDTAPLPDDITGLRRFVLISLQGKLSEKSMTKLIRDNRDHLWAEAVSLYKNRKSARLPQDMWGMSADIAEEHRGGDRSFEEGFFKYALRWQESRACDFVHIPSVLKIMKDGVETPDGKSRSGGGWIRDINSKLQSKAAEILKNNGYEPAKLKEKGQQSRIWRQIKGDTENEDPPF